MKKRNPLLEPEEIEKRLKALKNGFASNAIEGNPLPQEEKYFLIDLVRQGKTGENENTPFLFNCPSPLALYYFGQSI